MLDESRLAEIEAAYPHSYGGPAAVIHELIAEIRRLNKKWENARTSLRNLLIETEYLRTGNLPTSEWLNRAEGYWLTHATDLHPWDRREGL